MKQKYITLGKGAVFVLCLLFTVGLIFVDNGFSEVSSRCVTSPKKADNKCNEFTFDATSSYDPNNKKITVFWDFGDGQTSTEPVVKHVYEKSGEYLVTLKVTNDTGVECSTSTTTQKVKVNLPPQASFTSVDMVCVNKDIVFDAATTSDDTPSKLTYSWDFGDGTTGKGMKVTKSYAKSGVYDVKLMVDDNAGTVCSTDSVSKAVVINAPPMADAGKDQQLCLGPNEEMKVTFNGSASKDPDGDPLDYVWDFGDGTTGSGSKVTHVYSKAGDYTAKLSVNDNSGTYCGSAMDTVKVSINRSPLADAGEDISACLSEGVVFDASKSVSPDGKALMYKWDFGDGSSAEGSRVTHAYKKGGEYKAVLTVDDGSGSKCALSTDVKNVSVSAPPMAKLADVGAVCAGDRVMLDASGSSSPSGTSLKYTWDFGDGATMDDGSKVSHMYAKGGTYTVRVMVEKVAGSHCETTPVVPCGKDTASTRIMVNTPPVADAGPNYVCCAGKENLFDAKFSTDSDGDALKYMWNFGDGVTAEGAKVKHTYAKSGTYKVTLTVDDGKGTKCSKSSDSFTATVLEKPVPVIEVR